MQNINLEIEKIDDICQQWHIEELALFGSVLREDFNPNSDIDVLLSFAEDAKITFFDLDDIEQKSSELFNHPVDVVTKRAIEQSHNRIRKKNILENAKIIYEQRLRNYTRHN